MKYVLLIALLFGVTAAHIVGFVVDLAPIDYQQVHPVYHGLVFLCVWVIVGIFSKFVFQLMSKFHSRKDDTLSYYHFAFLGGFGFIMMLFDVIGTLITVREYRQTYRNGYLAYLDGQDEESNPYWKVVASKYHHQDEVECHWEKKAYYWSKGFRAADDFRKNQARSEI